MIEDSPAMVAYFQLHKMSGEELQNLLHSVIAQIKEKGGFSKDAQKLAIFAIKLKP